MKTATILTVLAVALTTNASALPAATPEPEAEAKWCTWVGQSCWKVKRTADAFAEAIGTSGNAGSGSVEARFSNQPGGAAYNAKRSINGLASIIASTGGDPEAFYNALGLDVHFEPDEEAAGPEKRDLAAREADAKWCTWVGQSCWKVRRAAEAVVNTIDSFEKREPDEEAAPGISRREANPKWCTWVGQSCWKRDLASDVQARCNGPAGACTKAQRDLTAMYHAARSVLDELPTPTQ